MASVRSKDWRKTHAKKKKRLSRGRIVWGGVGDYEETAAQHLAYKCRIRDYRESSRHLDTAGMVKGTSQEWVIELKRGGESG